MPTFKKKKKKPAHLKANKVIKVRVQFSNPNSILYNIGLQTQNSGLALTNFQGWSGRMKKGGEISQAERIIACPPILLAFLFPALPLTYYVTLSESFHLHVSIFSFVKQDNKYCFLSLSWVLLLSPSINIYWMLVGHIRLR